MGYVQTLAVTLTRRAAETLIAEAQATPDDKLTWQPMAQGRTILEQLVECALVNHKWAEILATKQYARLPKTQWTDAARDFGTRETVLAHLTETTDALVTAIEAVHDDEIGRVLAVPAEDGVDLTVGEGCLYAYWNMVYHAGQIGYIQTLYGDMV